MTTTLTIENPAMSAYGAPAPLVEISLDLTPGMLIYRESTLGNLPFVVIESGGTRFIISLKADNLSELGQGHLAIARQLAGALCQMCDQVRGMVLN